MPSLGIKGLGVHGLYTSEKEENIQAIRSSPTVPALLTLECIRSMQHEIHAVATGLHIVDCPTPLLIDVAKIMPSYYVGEYP